MNVLIPTTPRARRAATALTGLALVAAPLSLAPSASAADDQWSYRIDSVATGVSQAYQAGFDPVNRTLYLTDAQARTDRRAKTPVYDSSGTEIGWNWTYTSTGGSAKVVAVDAAKRAVSDTYDYTNLTRLSGKKESEPHSWEGIADTVLSQSSMRTHFSPNGIAIDPLTQYDGTTDPTIITTHVRQQGLQPDGSSKGYGGGIVVFRASQGAPTDADRIWQFDDTEPVSDGSRRIAVNTRTHKAFITNMGTGRSADPNARRGYVTVIDLPTKKVEARIAIPAPTGGGAKDGGVIGVDVDEANNHVYVGTISQSPADDQTKLFRIDANGLDTSNAQDKTLNAAKVTELDAVVPSNARPHYSPEDKRIYVASYNQGKVTVVEGDTSKPTYGSVLATIDSPSVNSVVADPERGIFYTANLGEQKVIAYSTKTFEKLLDIPTGAKTRPNDVHIDPVTHEVWVGHFSYGGSSAEQAQVIKVFEPGVDPSGNGTAELEVANSSSVFGKAARTTVTVTDEDGRSATGNVTLRGAGKAQTVRLKRGQATFTLPATLARATHTLTFRYAGNRDLDAATTTAKHTVRKAGTSVAAKATKRPTSKAKGKLAVSVRRASGNPAPTGTVRVELKKGKTTKRVNATLVAGKRTVTLPRLKKGTWRVTVRYSGNGNYTGSATTVKVTVRK